MHAYTTKSVRPAIEAGVKCIEHGHLLDEPTIKLLAEKGIWLSLRALDEAPASQAEDGEAYAGRLGVIEEGALADLLLVDGDPIADITLVEDPAKNFVVIMKDGKVYKNTLQ